MGRDAEQVGLRHEGQHGYETVALDRASRRASGQLVKRALERPPRGTVAIGQQPLECAPIDRLARTRPGERMTAPRDDDEAVVEQDLDLELVTIDGIVDAAEHEIEVALPELI